MFSTVLLTMSGARALFMLLGLTLLSWWPVILVGGGLALWAWGLKVTRAEQAPEPAPKPEPVPEAEPEPVQVPAQRRAPVAVPRQRGAGSRSRNIPSGSENPNPR